MKIEDLLEQLAFDSGDDQADYKNASRRWLNLARSFIADRHRWRCATRVDATFTTTSGTARYAVTDTSGNKYDRVVSPMLYDQTNNTQIWLLDLPKLRALDPDEDDTGSPVWWSDAGCDDDGNRLIQFYPTPDATLTINFLGAKRLTALTAANDTATEDPYFGDVEGWGACFAAGMRYYHDLNNNENSTHMAFQLSLFEKLIRARVQSDATAGARSFEFRKWRVDSGNVNLGRLDPSQFPRC